MVEQMHVSTMVMGLPSQLNIIELHIFVPDGASWSNHWLNFPFWNMSISRVTFLFWLSNHLVHCELGDIPNSVTVVNFPATSLLHPYNTFMSNWPMIFTWIVMNISLNDIPKNMKIIHILITCVWHMYLQDLHVTSPWPWLRLALQSSILATTSHPLAEGRFLVASAAAAREADLAQRGLALLERAQRACNAKLQRQDSGKRKNHGKSHGKIWTHAEQPMDQWKTITSDKFLELEGLGDGMRNFQRDSDGERKRMKKVDLSRGI